MKILFAHLILFGLLSLAACKKSDILPLGNHIGDYEWIYTEISETEYLTNTESTDKYGLRITSDNKLIFFKNGIEIKRSKILQHVEGETFPKPDDYLIYETTKNGGPVLHISGDTLKDFFFPHSSNNNTFLKKQ